MPNCVNIPSMPKVRDSSGTMGTTFLPIFLSRHSAIDGLDDSECRAALLVLESFDHLSIIIQRGNFQLGMLGRPAWHRSAECGTTRFEVFDFVAVCRWLVERRVTDFFITDRNPEASSELEQFRFVHLLLIVRDVATFARFAKPIAFDGLGQHHGRFAVLQLGRHACKRHRLFRGRARRDAFFPAFRRCSSRPVSIVPGICQRSARGCSCPACRCTFGTGHRQLRSFVWPASRLCRWPAADPSRRPRRP